MNEVFADTSGWANYFVRTESFHQDAKGLMQQWYKDQIRVITINYILSELVVRRIIKENITMAKEHDVIGRIISRPEALRLARQILINAERERLSAAEFEAARGLQWEEDE